MQELVAYMPLMMAIVFIIIAVYQVIFAPKDYKPNNRSGSQRSDKYNIPQKQNMVEKV